MQRYTNDDALHTVFVKVMLGGQYLTAEDMLRMRASCCLLRHTISIAMISQKLADEVLQDAVANVRFGCMPRAAFRNDRNSMILRGTTYVTDIFRTGRFESLSQLTEDIPAARLQSMPGFIQLVICTVYKTQRSLTADPICTFDQTSVTIMAAAQHADMSTHDTLAALVSFRFLPASEDCVSQLLLSAKFRKLLQSILYHAIRVGMSEGRVICSDQTDARIYDGFRQTPVVPIYCYANNAAFHDIVQNVPALSNVSPTTVT